MSNSATEQSDAGKNKPSTTTEDFIYVDDETGDSEFEPQEGSAGQDDESIAPEEDVPDEGEIDNLMKESEMSLSDLLAAYGVPPSEIPAAGAAVTPISSTSTSERRTTRKRRHNGASVTAEQLHIPALTSAPETTISSTAADGHNHGIVSPSNDLIEIDLTKESNEEEAASEDRQRQPDIGALMMGSDDAITEYELVHSESEEVIESEDDEEDEEELEEDDLMAGDEEEEDDDYWCKAFATGESPAYNSDEDEDYQPNVEGTGDWRGDIRIGEEYQAVVPPVPLLPNRRVDSHLGAEANLLWQPGHLSDAATDRYERTYTQTIAELPEKVATPDDEEALFLLLRTGYDPDEALSRIKNKPVAPYEIRPPIKHWSEEECANFEKGFLAHGKNFFKIQASKLPHKTTKEIVEFYYFYKKTARYDEFVRIAKLDKNKPSHTGLTDFMDILFEQYEAEATAVAAATVASQENPSTSINPIQGGNERRAQSQPAPSPSGDGTSSGSSHSVIAVSSQDSGDSQHEISSPLTSPSSPFAAAPNTVAGSSKSL